MPPKRGWQIRREEIAENNAFIFKCLSLWDEGKNTYDISTILFQPESIVETAVRLGRERRRAEKGP